MPKVSVIIPFLNAEKYLICCLTSVMRQTIRDIEVICIDNGATDRTREYTETICSKDNRIRIIDCVERGAGTARNVGIAVARGEYLSFVDADDFLCSKSALEVLYNGGQRACSDLSRGNLYMFMCRQNVSTQLHTLGKKIWFQESVITTYKEEPLLWLPIQHQAYLFRREFVIENKLHYPGLLRGQDAPFMLSALLNAKRISCSTEATYAYRKEHRAHAILDKRENLIDYIKSIIQLQDMLLQRGMVRQWYLVLVRTSKYLNRVCATKLLSSDMEVAALLGDMLLGVNDLGEIDCSPYNIARDLKEIKMLMRTLSEKQ